MTQFKHKVRIAFKHRCVYCAALRSPAHELGTTAAVAATARGVQETPVVQDEN